MAAQRAPSDASSEVSFDPEADDDPKEAPRGPPSSPPAQASPKDEEEDEEEGLPSSLPAQAGPKEEDQEEEESEGDVSRMSSKASGGGGGSEGGRRPLSERSNDQDSGFSASDRTSLQQDSESRPLTPESSADGGASSMDQLMHWWCQKQMLKCLKKLQRHPKAGPFMEPLPWEELGLDDYPSVVKDPCDLQTIQERYDAGEYDDDDGLANPEWFWEDVELCWSNCLLYYEDDLEVEAAQMASDMREFAADLEDEFWTSLENFEESLNQGDQALTSLANAADVAASAMEDAAVTAYQEGEVIVQDLTDYLSRMLGWGRRASGPAQPQKKAFKMSSLSSRQDIKEHYKELFETYFDACDAEVLSHDLDDIQQDLEEAFRMDWPVGKEQELGEEDSEEERENLKFEGVAEKIAAKDLLPPGMLKTAAKRDAWHRRTHARTPKSGRSANSSRRSSVADSVHSSRQASRAGSRGNSRRSSASARASRFTRESSRSGNTSARSSRSTILRRMKAKSASAASRTQDSDTDPEAPETPEKRKTQKPDTDELKRFFPKSRSSLMGESRTG